MVLVDIEGVNIEFPFAPYECQTKYMSQVIKALTLKCDAALESPTGTGKTLSLLCATLGWLEKEKLNFAPTLQQAMILANKTIVQPANLMPKIYYCSRTHSQLAQVVRELNKTVYKGVKVTLLASRDQLCIHEKVSKEEDNRVKSMMCRALVSKHTCNYHNRWNTCDSDQLKDIYGNSGKVLDIEDLVGIAKKHSHCPYYQAKSMKETAELILLPYNYLISAELRRIHEVDLNGSIVIFDEAHNLEAVCEECTSVELTTTDIAMSIKDLQKAIETMQEETAIIRSHLDETTEAFGKQKEKPEEPAFDIGSAAIVLQMIFELEKVVDEYYCDKNNKSKYHREIPGKVFPGAALLDLLESAKFTFDKANEVTTLLRKAADYLHEKAEATGGAKIHDTKGYLYKFEGFLSTVFTSHPIHDGKANPLAELMSYEQRKSENAVRDFQLYMYKEKLKDSDEEGSKIVINYWCFSAGIAMKSLKQRGVRTVIVTSGTLSPLNSYMKNIGLDFGCTLENGHAADSKQVICGIVKRGNINDPEFDLNGKYENRKNENYFVAVSSCLKDLARKVPQGVLVFFASYSLMNATINAMQKKASRLTSVWEDIAQYKQIVVEPRQKRDLKAVRLEFDMAVRTKKGAMFFAVCRGKVSEGIDFADADSRAVAVVGIPYPPLMNPRVKLKKVYLDERRLKDKNIHSGEEWYRMEAFRAVNQAIGRVLRHVDDFGVVALLDARFSTVPHAMFSSWLRPSMRTFDQMRDFDKVAERFFGERGHEIEESESRMKLMATTNNPMRAAKRRLAESTENYEVNYLVGGYEIQAREPADENVAVVESIAVLGEKEDMSVQKRPEKVIVPTGFGAVNSIKAPQQPARKKIRLAPPKFFENAPPPDNRPPAPQLAIVKPTSSQKSEDVVYLNSKDTYPPEIQRILQQDDKEVKTMLKDLGTTTYKRVLGVMKAINSGLPQEDALKNLKKLLLPTNPKHLIAVSRYFSNASLRKQIVEECHPLLV